MFRDRIKKLFGQEGLGPGVGEYLYDDIIELSIDRVNHVVFIKSNRGESETRSDVERIDIANDLKNRISAFKADDEGTCLKFIDPIEALFDADTRVLWLAPSDTWGHPTEWD